MDTIRGKVTKVVDGDTFDMSVTYFGTNNTYKYGSSERIRISGFNSPELNTNQGQRDKSKLEEVLQYKEIRVYVETRDVYGRIVGRVEFI